MNKDFSLLTSGREDYDDFLEWLEAHNWCKVTPCLLCYHYRAVKTSKYGRCARHGMDVCADDYCSDAEERTKYEL